MVQTHRCDVRISISQVRFMDAILVGSDDVEKKEQEIPCDS